LVLSGFWGVLAPDQIAERAKSAAASALQHDPNLAAGYTACALVATCIEFNAERATAAWDRALELDPMDLEARTMRAAFDICYTRAAFDEAVDEMRAVIERDPLSAYAHASLSVVLGFAGRYDEALAEAKRARELDAGSFLVVWSEVNAVAFGGNASDMVNEIPHMLSRNGRHPWLMMALGAAFSRTGWTDRADAVFTELSARSRIDYVQPTVLAITAEWAGRRPEALGFLRRAVEIRDPALVAFQSPHMSSLRTAREFREILAGLRWELPVFAPSEVARA
jgi:tetratricopeptide (TPR) repeat protein